MNIGRNGEKRTQGENVETGAEELSGWLRFDKGGSSDSEWKMLPYPEIWGCRRKLSVVGRCCVLSGSILSLWCPWDVPVEMA